MSKPLPSSFSWREECALCKTCIWPGDMLIRVMRQFIHPDCYGYWQDRDDGDVGTWQTPRAYVE